VTSAIRDPVTANEPDQPTRCTDWSCRFIARRVGDGRHPMLELIPTRRLAPRFVSQTKRPPNHLGLLRQTPPEKTVDMPHLLDPFSDLRSIEPLNHARIEKWACSTSAVLSILGRKAGLTDDHRDFPRCVKFPSPASTGMNERKIHRPPV